MHEIGSRQSYQWQAGKVAGHYLPSLEDPESDAYDLQVIEENLANLEASLGILSDAERANELKHADPSNEIIAKYLHVAGS